MNKDLALTKVVLDPALPLEKTDVTWDDVRRFTRKYIWVILGVFVLTVGGAYTTLSLLSELYETEAGLLVKLGRENLDPPAVSRNVPLTAGLRREEVVSEIAILKSPGLISDVVDEIGVDAFRPVRIPPASFFGRAKFELKKMARSIKEGYHEALYALDLKKRLNERDTIISGLMDGLSVEPLKDSDVISVKLRTPDPTLGRKIETSMIAQYLQRRIAVRRTEGVQEFLNGMAKQRETDLVRAESQKQGWKRRMGLYSTPEQKALLLKQIRELSGTYSQTRAEIESLGHELEASKKALANTPEYMRASEQRTPNPLVQSFKEKLLNLESERTKLMTKYTPDSQIMRDLDDQIKQFRTLIDKEESTQVGAVTSQVNPTRQMLEQRVHQNTIRLEGLQANLQVQHDELSALQNQLTSIDNADGKLADLERARTVAEQDYLTIVRRKLDTDVSEKLDKDRISNVSVLMAPTSTLQPVYPKKLLVFGVSLAAGLLLGIGLALLLNLLNDRVETTRDVEVATGMPCLGSIGYSA